ncbi:MAG: thioredoxin [Cytophagales bacterium]|nr:thioredoxin [Cytophagales bacterium]
MKSLVNKGKIVLIDFYADWCGPCQTLTPIISQVAKEYTGKINVLKINIDKNQPLANKLSIRSIPTMVLYREGQQVWRHSGLLTKKELESVLEQNI